MKEGEQMDYCGKNGCFEIDAAEDFTGEYFNVYLNSPIVYIYRGEESVRVIGGERPDPDITFELFEDDQGELLTGRMEIETLFSEGTAEFIIALLEYRDEIGDKDGLVGITRELLDQEDAVWGVIHPDPEELSREPGLPQ